MEMMRITITNEEGPEEVIICRMHQLPDIITELTGEGRMGVIRYQNGNAVYRLF